MSTKPKATQKAAGAAPEPSFFKDQLMTCKALGASPDVISAVLVDGKAYTLDEARAAIDNYLERKV